MYFFNDFPFRSCYDGLVHTGGLGVGGCCVYGGVVLPPLAAGAHLPFWGHSPSG